MFGQMITRLFGSKHERDLKRLWPLVESINQRMETLAGLADEDLPRVTGELRERLAAGETPDDILPEAFALVKEACRRLVGRTWTVRGHPERWEMVPFDVQLLGAIVLHLGKIAEMATGEGKTLVATMPLYLNALAGKGAHLVTVNDYLAQRDSEWMGPVYDMLGLTVGVIQNDTPITARQEAYRADITYGTNNEFGFDYLRDNMATRLEDRVQRGHHYAIVDEVDSVLIDEARTPLIISGPVAHSTQSFSELKPVVNRLVRAQTDMVSRLVTEAEELLRQDQGYPAGEKLLLARRGAPKNKRLLRVEQETGVKKLIHRVELDYIRDKRLSELEEELFFSIDEKAHNIVLTERGRESLSASERELLIVPDLSEELEAIDADHGLEAAEKARRKDVLHLRHAEISDRIHSISQLLRAYSLFEKDVEYVVKDGRVVIVDEFTGRILPGRRYSDGLHQALEAKEGVEVQGETQTLATITLQNYFRLYEKLAGMTGTAETEAGEFWQIYKLDLTVVPTNEPVRRVDYEDVIYRTRREKYNAIVEELEALYREQRPVLVGTVSVEVSETLSRLLKRKQIPHEVLNAKHHQREAEIVSRAGQPGAVTIATNMAGRGTDIKLGPGVVRPGNGDDPDQASGGLHILGTERHESRRIDRQLRGRAGRQGDPGSSRFYLSLEDDLMRLFGSERIAGVMDRLGAGEGEVIEHPLVTRAIERAQKRVEAHNFDIRKHLLEYDDVMNQQRQIIYARRLAVLEGADLREELEAMIREVVGRKVERTADPKVHPDDWDLPALQAEMARVFLQRFPLDDEQHYRREPQALLAEMEERAIEALERKAEGLGPELTQELMRLVMLRITDEEWKDHLYELDGLKSGIGLRAYGQRDPLIEYKNEAYELFVGLNERIQDRVVELFFRAQLATPAPVVGERPYERGGSPGTAPLPVGSRATSPLGSGMAPLPSRGAVPSPAGGGFPAGSRPTSPGPGGRAPGPKVGRNEPCPCGSGLKYKKCHGR